MTETSSDLAAAKPCLSPDLSPPPTDFAMLAEKLSRNATHITEGNLKRRLARQAQLLDATFCTLMAHALQTEFDHVPAYRAALNAQRLFLQCVQQLDALDEKNLAKRTSKKKLEAPS